MNNPAGQQYLPTHGGGFGNHGRGSHGRESDIPPVRYNCGEQGHVQGFCTNLRTLCGYSHNSKHMTEDSPELLAKMEAKRGGNIHMINTKPCDGVEPPLNVCVITRGGACTCEDATQGPLQPKTPQYMSHKEELIRKAIPLPTFDAWKQKEVMFEARREFDERREPKNSKT